MSKRKIRELTDKELIDKYFRFESDLKHASEYKAHEVPDLIEYDAVREEMKRRGITKKDIEARWKELEAEWYEEYGAEP